jgi:hypothetical protein
MFVNATKGTGRKKEQK